MPAFASELIEWLGSWPAPVWSAIGGSAITLSGVMFSDWRNTRRLHLQQAFAARESELARTLATKKEVYLSTSGTLARTQEYLLSLPTADSMEDKAPMIEFAEFIGKVAMVGQTSTAILSQSLAAEYTEAHAKLMQFAAGVQRAHANARNHRKYRKKALQQAERVGIEIAKFLETGVINDAVFGALQRSQARFNAEVQDHWTKEIAQLGLVARETNRFMAKALEIITPITDSSAKLLIAVRRELGQTTDEAQLLKSMKEHRDAAFGRLRNLIGTFEAQWEEEERAQQADA